MTDAAPVRTWHCTCLAPPSSSSPVAPTSSSALIILNTPIADGTLLRRLWNHADVRICADGGANRLRDFLASTSTTEEGWLPDAICGDLDSLDPEVEAYFKGKGVEVIKDEDQYSTDLGKCLSLVLPVAPPSHSTSSSRLAAKLKGKAVRNVTVHGGLSGRLDQTVHTLHALMGLEEGTHDSIKCPPYQRWTSRAGRERSYEGPGGDGIGEEFWVVDTDAQSAACCLNAGRHRIRVGWPSNPTSASSQSSTHAAGDKKRPRTCGILPIGIEQAVFTTRGLEWDLDKTVTTMTGMVSTSNQIPRGQEWVEVETDKPLIWTMDLSEL